MKYPFVTALAVLLTVQTFCGGCRKSGSDSPVPIEGENFDKDASYAIGMNIGAMLAGDGIIPNLNEFLRGMRDQLSGGETMFSEAEAGEKIQEAFSSMMVKREAETKVKEAEFFAENGRKPGVITTASGLQYEVIREGVGPKPTAENTVRVHYEGSLINGAVFDSSVERGFPVEFPLNEVISGWTEGLQLMGVGGKFKFYIPSELGYGPRGAGSSIPPYATLIFQVELLDILDN